jgi:hypothetical protein
MVLATGLTKDTQLGPALIIELVGILVEFLNNRGVCL